MTISVDRIRVEITVTWDISDERTEAAEDMLSDAARSVLKQLHGQNKSMLTPGVEFRIPASLLQLRPIDISTSAWAGVLQPVIPMPNSPSSNGSMMEAVEIQSGGFAFGRGAARAAKAKISKDIAELNKQEAGPQSWELMPAAGGSSQRMRGQKMRASKRAQSASDNYRW
ncbi:MAG: hypothetical protein S4CHLAM81_06620 [Chlamydiales bacterium]|nr:hypothetical protein [Chlamydiales bacterium]MCH9635446.1 hypothetical protein [Chlamydiales bacterium]MCH9703619.1 hypothetical protein [Chlamydiota bacterium]